MSVERAGQRLTFIMEHRDTVPAEVSLHSIFPRAARLDVRDATLRELFVALARHGAPASARLEEVAS